MREVEEKDAQRERTPPMPVELWEQIPTERLRKILGESVPN